MRSSTATYSNHSTSCPATLPTRSGRTGALWVRPRRRTTNQAIGTERWAKKKSNSSGPNASRYSSRLCSTPLARRIHGWQARHNRSHQRGQHGDFSSHSGPPIRGPQIAIRRPEARFKATIPLSRTVTKNIPGHGYIRLFEKPITRGGMILFLGRDGNTTGRQEPR